MKNIGHITAMVFLIFLSSCKKEQEVFEDNTIPEFTGIPTVQVENYVNRVFIDLLGREPLDTEMALEVELLESASLSATSRENLITKIQTNTEGLPNDSSYFIAYHKKLHEDVKARCIEGVSDGYIFGEYNLYEGFAFADSVNGNLVSYAINKAISQRLLDVITSTYEFREGSITLNEVHARMLNNSIYDEINMNSFNFINASFDDLFYRFPTTAEFDASYPIIENNEPSQILGEVAQNKDEFISILVNNQEFNEGIVRWVFLTLLAREPASNEAFDLANHFNTNGDFKYIQRKVLITDEYAGFD